ncbi:hypothetical protein MLD38_008472 [Melastoma candidum]|uniref:Uncharacterized protein n=1 Tax=Melastoma candidum TaxID=119954 RepID=A0ACB9RY58_9MYRT|nr:hypothetical protein MLD38_008472 [Melastoma candidum]
MVLGLRSKSRKSITVRVDYLVHVQEIKPWPPSQSLRSVDSLLIQWENGDQSSGSFACGAGDGKIGIGETFPLSVNMSREPSNKRGSGESFQKNCLEFSLYESARNKNSKSQLLGSAELNLAEYGIIRETASISIPLNCKKISRRMVQPVLYISIQPCDVESSSSSQKGELSREISLDQSGSSYALDQGNEDVEIASFTDDDKDDISINSTQIISDPTIENSGTLTSHDGKVPNSPKVNSATGNSSIKLQEKGVPLEEGPSIPKYDSQTGTTIKHHDFSDLPKSSKDSLKLLKEHDESLQGSQASTYTDTNSASFVEDDDKRSSVDNDGLNAPAVSSLYYPRGKEEDEQHENGTAATKATRRQQSSADDGFPRFTTRDTRKQVTFRKGSYHEQGDLTKMHALVNSVKLSPDLSGNIKRHNNSEIATPLGTISCGEEDKCVIAEKNSLEERSLIAINPKLEAKVAMLEEELREAAALEVSLYSVVAEHGSSSSKVHSPARRLSRFYIHACKAEHAARRESAASAIVSGLVLVCKACGNDVPRLTFWLSNAVVLRAIVGQIAGSEKASVVDSSGWEDPQNFIIALERVESWIFGRVVESVWWQSMTPHMQSFAAKHPHSKKAHAKKLALGNQEVFSVDLWKKAFLDACERLCPIRGGGHECGCLPIISRLVMEQLVGRLDVAMFNAILRESPDEMPTDPISDPISDSRVLPIPAAKSGFGAGVQLKNAIGDWSRWLSDLFGIGDDDSPGTSTELDDEKSNAEMSFKPFPLLNALSGLMMLPFDMLADRSTRKEVCPAFGVQLIRRVLDNFIPDDFSPDCVPEMLFDALDNKEDLDADPELITIIPYNASPVAYRPPLASSLTSFMGDMKSQTLTRIGSSLLRKSYTSDDELDEVDSPVSSIVQDAGKFSPLSPLPKWMVKGDHQGRNVLRYQLLRDAWKEAE